MNITGPIQSSLPPLQESVDQFLKVNQRFAGEVLHISNEQVVLAVNGVQIVAKMTSAEQLAVLLEKRYAYFIVKDVSDNQITLQLANPTQTENNQKPSSGGNLGQAILEQMGVTVDKGNLLIVQAAIDQGLKVTPELLAELKLVLDKTPQWGKREAQLAAALKSAGLPVTTESLNLAQNGAKEITNNFLGLYEQLEAEMNRPGISSQMFQNLRSLQSGLKDAIIQCDSSNEYIARQLFGSVKNLGTSIENSIAKVVYPAFEKELAELKQPGLNNQQNDGMRNERSIQDSGVNNLLLTLINQRHELTGNQYSRLASAIDNFTEGMRWMHFVNADPDHPLAKGQWTQLDLPISFGLQGANPLQRDTLHDMQIRVARENDENSGNSINPDYTRLVIQIDLDQGEMIKVDLSIVSSLIGAEITASNDNICLRASEELDEFQTGLSRLGYTLKTSKIELGGSKLEIGINEPDKILRPISSVDIGV